MDSNPDKELSPEPKRGRGREPGFRMTEEHRTKIANAQILNRLISGFNGEVDLTNQQVQIGLKLIDKVLPNLQATQISGDAENPLEVHSTIELVDGQGSGPSEA